MGGCGYVLKPLFVFFLRAISCVDIFFPPHPLPQLRAAPQRPPPTATADLWRTWTTPKVQRLPRRWHLAVSPTRNWPMD